MKKIMLIIYALQASFSFCGGNQYETQIEKLKLGTTTLDALITLGVPLLKKVNDFNLHTKTITDQEFLEKLQTITVFEETQKKAKENISKQIILLEIEKLQNELKDTKNELALLQQKKR